MTRLDLSDRAPDPPWWRSRPRVGSAAAAATFAAVVLLRSIDHDGQDGLAVLVVVPVVVLGLVFGRRAGVLAGAAGLVFAAGWARAGGAALGAGGWTALVLPPLAVGFLAGWAGDAHLAAARLRRLAGDAHRRQQRTIERTETVVQSLVAAKWSFEAGRTDEGLTVLTDAIAAAEHLVVDLVRVPAPEADAAARAAPRTPVDLTERLARPADPAVRPR